MVQFSTSLKLIIIESYKRLLDCDIIVCKIHWFYSNIIDMILIKELE
jgi:hypothetical protein